MVGVAAVNDTVIKSAVTALTGKFGNEPDGNSACKNKTFDQRI